MRPAVQGARIAIKPRHANRFFRALVDAALGEVWQVNIGDQRRRRLNESAKSGQNMRRSVFSFINSDTLQAQPNRFGQHGIHARHA